MAPRIRQSGRCHRSRRTIPEGPPIRFHLSRNRSAERNRGRAGGATSSADADSLSRRASATSRRGSRREAIDLPAATGAASVSETVLKPVRPALPKFDLFRFHPISAPMRRERNFFALKTLSHRFETRVENLPGVDYVALLRGPRGEAAARG